MSIDSDELWFIAPGCEILGRHWPSPPGRGDAEGGHAGEDVLVFHTGSGDTHALDAFRYHVLSCLPAPGLSLSQLRLRLALDLELAPEALPEAELRELLSDLYGLGLLDYRREGEQA